MNINDVLGLSIPRMARPININREPEKRISQYEQSVQVESSDEDELTVKKIVAEKPKVKIVRKFLKDNLEDIKNSDEEGFD